MVDVNEGQAGGFDLSKVYVWIKGIESKLNNARRELTIVKNDNNKKYERIKKEIKKTPRKPIDSVIEDAKSGSKITQIIVTLGQDTHFSLRSFAGQEGTSMDDAAASLIVEGLQIKGFLE